MKMNSLKKTIIKNFIFVLVFNFIWMTLSLTSFASEGKIVRVGFFESAFNQKDDNGKKSGYAYDYMQEIAAYTGWKYEYVEGTWTELMEKLKQGEIDLISDVSYDVERENQMLFSSLPMGNERFFIFSDEKHEEITPYHLSALNGKKIGISGFSIEKEILKNWCAMEDIELLLVEYGGDEKIAEAFQKGEIDAFVATDAFISLKNSEPILEIGSSDIYFGINYQRADLKKEIDFAMGEILGVDPTYNQKLSNKYNISGISHYLPQEDLDWITKKDIIKIGYRENYLSFCGTDPETGELTGALKDYLELASKCFENYELQFETVPFETAEDALLALNRHEIDCIFPTTMSRYEAEEKDVLISKPLIKTDMYAIIKDSSFQLKGNCTAAVNRGNLDYLNYLESFFPDWKIDFYDTIEECIEAVATKKANCIIVSNYRINSLMSLIEEYNLTYITTSSSMEIYFAMNRDNQRLYSILNRVVILIPETSVNASLAKYTMQERNITVRTFIRENIGIFCAIISVILIIMTAIICISVRAQLHVRKLNAQLKQSHEELNASLEKTKEQKELLHKALQQYRQADTDRRTDFLTGLRNRQDMFEVLQSVIMSPEQEIKAMFLLDIDNFKMYNDHYGHVAGDECLRKIAIEILKYGHEHNILFFRYGGEEILGMLFGDEDADKLANDIVKQVYDLHIERDDTPTKAVTISLGYTTDNKRYEKMVNLADEAMYQAKSRGKNQACCYEKI